MSEDKSFAEVALNTAGKSVKEAESTGKIDKADDQVENLFKHKTTDSPIYKAVWESRFPDEFFENESKRLDTDAENRLRTCIDVIQRHTRDGTLYDNKQKLKDSFLRELGDDSIKYWGLLIDKEYGGVGLSLEEFAKFLMQVAVVDPTVAGLASVHGCIGAVDPVRTFGTEELKNAYLPELANGKKLSGFALTEPGAGSDLTALKTTAVLDGDHYVVNGEKLFITNAKTDRTVGLVCLIDGKPAVLIADLPKKQNANFKIKSYKIYALKHTNNNGLVFKDFKVPKENLLVPPIGDGLTIAYHGLNHGRVSLCANAAGVMRKMLADMLPWAKYRETYGEPIEKRELVQRRVATLAGYIVASDAITEWCARLIDRGYRGEMECIVAKIFGSEKQKEAAIELYMKTHGGRSFLGGHFFGDNVHEFLAPCIYEGEGEMLSMALFKSLVKTHGREYFEPIAKTLMKLGVNKPNFFNPKHLWALKGPMCNYSLWVAKQVLLPKCKGKMSPSKTVLNDHMKWAMKQLQKSALSTSLVMVKHQLGLVDRQCRMNEISSRIQTLVMMAVTASYASNKDDVTKQAADLFCLQCKKQLRGDKYSDVDYKKHMKLGKKVIAGEFQQIAGIEADDILMQYNK
jgi:alkylation response protein AidB-like acyl-CoA dehydrogenase